MMQVLSPIKSVDVTLNFSKDQDCKVTFQMNESTLKNESLISMAFEKA